MKKLPKQPPIAERWEQEDLIDDKDDYIVVREGNTGRQKLIKNGKVEYINKDSKYYNPFLNTLE